MSTNGSQPLLEVEDAVASYPVGRGLVGAVTRAPGLEVRMQSTASRSRSTVARCSRSSASRAAGRRRRRKQILRLIQPSGGSIRFDGREITELSSKELRPLRRRMQIVYQDPYSRSTRASASERRSRSRSRCSDRIAEERREEVKRALELAGLTPPTSTSTATRTSSRRASGSASRSRRASSSTPSSSSPTSPSQCSTCRSGRGSSRSSTRIGTTGLAVLMMHDLSGRHYADRIAVMYLGRIVEEGPTREVIENPQHPYTRALSSPSCKRDPRDRGRTPQILRETPNSVHIPPGCRFNPRCPMAIAECKTVRSRAPATGGEPGSRALAACIRV